MRIAFIILAHKNPLQLERLLRRLSHPQVDCYVHLDAKADMPAFQPLLRMPQVYFIPKRSQVNWAGFGTIRASLDSMEVVLAAQRNYTHLHLISAQDYPLLPIREILDFFATHPGKEFIDILPPDALSAVMTKITRYHFEDIQFKGKYFLTGCVNKILPARKTPMGLETWGGSLWWSITEPCATYCIDFIKQHPAFLHFYKYSWGGDEFIYQTIIMNHPGFRKQVMYDNLRYIDWSEGKAHPRTFTINDLPAMLQSGKLFARKFDIATGTDILDQLDTIAHATMMDVPPSPSQQL